MQVLKERTIRQKTKLETDYYYGVLRENLESNNYKVISLCDAGNYLCNNVFPSIDNIEDIKKLSNTILNYISTLSDVFNIVLLQLNPTETMENNMLKDIEYCKKAKEMDKENINYEVSKIGTSTRVFK